jgi:uncharacterized membrane protein
MNHIPTFSNFIHEHNSFYEITHESYCFILDNHLNENIFSDIKDKAIQAAARLLGPIKDFIKKIANDFNVGISQIIEAFKQKSVFEFLKAIKFNLGLVLKAFKELTSLIRNGLFNVFEKIARTGIFEKLRSGAIKIDEFLDEYPLIKKIGGLAIGAILIYMWLNMTFIGDFDYDFNWSDILAAFAGKFSLADLFLSPSGLMLITLFVTGPYLSIPWLGSSMYNLAIAIFYTGYVKLRDTDTNIKNAIMSIAKW